MSSIEIPEDPFLPPFVTDLDAMNDGWLRGLSLVLSLCVLVLAQDPRAAAAAATVADIAVRRFRWINRNILQELSLAQSMHGVF
jgi:hypothetical protein